MAPASAERTPAGQSRNTAVHTRWSVSLPLLEKTNTHPGWQQERMHSLAQQSRAHQTSTLPNAGHAGQPESRHTPACPINPAKAHRH
jgi:hypothetical protein